MFLAWWSVWRSHRRLAKLACGWGLSVGSRLKPFCGVIRSLFESSLDLWKLPGSNRCRWWRFSFGWCLSVADLVFPLFHKLVFHIVGEKVLIWWRIAQCCRCLTPEEEAQAPLMWIFYQKIPLSMQIMDAPSNRSSSTHAESCIRADPQVFSPTAS